MTNSAIESDVKNVEETQEAKHYAHIINPTDNTHIWHPSMLSARDIVTVARENQIEIVALCGHRFIPTQDAEGLDACQICFDVAGMLMRNEGE